MYDHILSNVWAAVIFGVRRSPTWRTGVVTCGIRKLMALEICGGQPSPPVSPSADGRLIFQCADKSHRQPGVLRPHEFLAP